MMQRLSLEAKADGIGTASKREGVLVQKVTCNTVKKGSVASNWRMAKGKSDRFTSQIPSPLESLHLKGGKTLFCLISCASL